MKTTHEIAHKHLADLESIVDGQQQAMAKHYKAAMESAVIASAYADESAKLRAFAQEIMEAWPEGGIDGGDLQDIATRHGLLTPKIMHSPCGDNCACYEVVGPDEFESGVECFIKTPLLTGE